MLVVIPNGHFRNPHKAPNTQLLSRLQKMKLFIFSIICLGLVNANLWCIPCHCELNIIVCKELDESTVTQLLHFGDTYSVQLDITHSPHLKENSTIGRLLKHYFTNILWAPVNSSQKTTTFSAYFISTSEARSVFEHFSSTSSTQAKSSISSNFLPTSETTSEFEHFSSTSDFTSSKPGLDSLHVGLLLAIVTLCVIILIYFTTVLCLKRLRNVQLQECRNALELQEL